MERSPERKPRSVWPYLGVGCLAIVLVGVIGFCTAGYFVFRTAKEISEQFTDPEVRRARVLEALGTADLPEGYDPVLAFSVPLVFDIVVIGDVVSTEDGDLEEIGDHAFVLVSLARADEGDRERLDRFFAGEGGDLGSLKVDVVDFSAARIIGVGRTKASGGDVEVVALDAPVRRKDGERERHLVAAMRIRCRGDARERLAFWVETPPDGAGPVEELTDLTGSVGDPERVAEFLDRFRICRAE